MARVRRSDFETVAEVDSMILNDEPVQKVAPAPAPVQPAVPKEMTIKDNPYLTEDQKKVLVDYELKSLLDNVVSIRNNYTLIELKQYDVTAYYLVEAVGDNLVKAWEFYRDNTENPVASQFFDLIVALKPALQSCRNVKFVKLE